jgi:hypothetical protein
MFQKLIRRADQQAAVKIMRYLEESASAPDGAAGAGGGAGWEVPGWVAVLAAYICGQRLGRPSIIALHWPTDPAEPLVALTDGPPPEGAVCSCGNCGYPADSRVVLIGTAEMGSPPTPEEPR